MFVGRNGELQLLLDAFGEKRSATLIYGKRRVGKTTLIKKALENQQKTCVYYECLRGTMRDNIDGLTRELMRLKILNFATAFASFQDVFAYLNTLPRQFIIVIDEYPYLKHMTVPETVDSIFQAIIDGHLANIDLVVSGSHIGMMRDMLREGNALYGRFSTVIQLKELSYRQAAVFYSSKDVYDRIGFFGVFGGSPFVLEQLRDSESLQDNIIRTILNESSPVYMYASHFLVSDYSRSANSERIFAALGNGRKKYSELENLLDAKKTGNLSKQLKSLLEMDILSRNIPINRIGDAKKVKYEINDNLMRFYFTYLYRNQSALQMLGAKVFYDQYIAPTLTEYISRRFEELCRDYFAFLARQGDLPGIRHIGSFYYDDPAARSNGEFDVALDFGGTYTICEAKYFKKPMELDDIHREVGQIRGIKGLEVSRIGFISASGFAQKEDGWLYYTGDDLYADRS
ncbi:MAG: AAA family ATPase [Clostridia bacterium]|nr:AAA family ATPase [Clostridia bacterium]